MIKEEYIDKAWSNVDILDVFKDFHPEQHIIPKGIRYITLCPYHNDHHPSLWIEPDRHRVKCYACGETLTLFKLVQKEKGVNFPDAVRYIYEKYLPSIPIKDIYDFSETKSDETWKEKEVQKNYMAAVQDFYREEYLRDYHAANFCRNYAERRDDNPEGRWNKEVCDLLELGFAPGDRFALTNWARGRGMKLDILRKMGLVVQKETEEGKIYYQDIFFNRLLTPYTDKWDNVIAYIGRRLDWKDGEKDKYKNNASKKGENLLYDKSSHPWGLKFLSDVRKTGKAFLVEGASDAMSILGLGITNVLASAGGEWTEGQLSHFKSPQKPTLCFIPDIDPPTENVDGAMMGNGEKAVIRSAIRAIKMGFTVTIKAIPPTEDGSKIDAGAYFTDMRQWNKVKEVDFVVWYAGKYFSKSVSDRENAKAVKTVCRMLLEFHDDEFRSFSFRQLKSRFRGKDVWDEAIKFAKQDLNACNQEKSMDELGLNLRSKKMVAKGHCLYSITDKADIKKQLTNFIPRPLYHIRDGNLCYRIVEVNNGKEKPCTIAFEQEELSKADKCVSRLGINGDYSLFTDANEYKLFRALIYEGLKKAVMVNTIGWYKCGNDGFQVWGNGIFADNKWQEANEFGIVEYCGEYYYIPSCSIVNENTDDAMVLNMKRYNHINNETVNLEDYTDRVEEVFGNNGIVTLTFGIASIFRDIIFDRTGFFPLEFIFGPNASGKTAVAKTAMCLFLNSTQMANLGSSSLAGITRMMTMLSNVPILLNEYFDTIGAQKIDVIKGLFEGTGRLISSDNNNTFVQFNANCTMILTGQDLPDYDPAMFSRSLFIEQYKNVFNSEAKVKLDELQEYQEKGLTSITMSLLSHRQKFKESWKEAWSVTSERFNNDERLTAIPRRVIECWSILYGTIECLKLCGIKIPIRRDKMYNICTDHIIRQVEVMKNCDELAKFWSRIDYAHSLGKLIEGVVYRIQTIDEPILVSKNRVHNQLTNNEYPGRIMMLFLKPAYEITENLVKKDEKVISESSFKHYLENSPEFLGTKVTSTYFRVADEQGNLLLTPEPDPKTGKRVPLRKTARPMIFDYDALLNKYDLSLSSNAAKNIQVLE